MAITRTLYRPRAPGMGQYVVGGNMIDVRTPQAPSRTYNPLPPIDYGTTTTPDGGFPPDESFTMDPNAPQGGQGSINLRRGAPDYRGILDQYTGDWRARLNAGLAANEAQRLSRARASINRLGIRDASAMLPQLQQYGLTAEDLRLAQENPWSDLRAITQQAERQRGQGEAEFAARGGFRSGGTAQMLEDVEQGRARAEAQATEETLGGLGQDLFSSAEWERQQRDELEQRAAGLEAQLASAYQPYDVQAYWDPANQGYRYGNQIYDQYGNLIRSV